VAHRCGATVSSWAVPKPRPVPLEEAEAVAFYTWCTVTRWNGIPLSQVLVMIPNGQKLGGTERQRNFAMVRLKRQGFQVGVSDYFLPIPIGQVGNGGAAGLWIELKRLKGGRTSDEQAVWLLRMAHLGYAARIARGWEEAREIVGRYLRDSPWPVLTSGGQPPEGWV